MALSMALPMILPMNPKRKREDDERETHPAAKKKSIHVYTCITCNMEFSSYQALGGHRAGHNNRTKIDADVAPGSMSIKSYTCLLCFEKFVSGQALGGHMRKHRGAMEEKEKPDLRNRKIIVSEKFKEDKIVVFKTDPIFQSGCNCGSTPVTRDFFPRKRVRDDVVPVVTEPVSEEHNSWLDLKLGPPGGD